MSMQSEQEPNQPEKPWLKKVLDNAEKQLAEMPTWLRPSEPKAGAEAHSCPDWNSELPKLNALFVLQAMSTPRSVKPVKEFAFCPWCGKSLTASVPVAAGAKARAHQVPSLHDLQIETYLKAATVAQLRKELASRDACKAEPKEPGAEARAEAAEIVHRWYADAKQAYLETLVSGNQQLQLTNAIAAALAAKQQQIQRLYKERDLCANAINLHVEMEARLNKKCDALAQQLASLRADYASLEEHHKATDEIIADARGQSPENGKALLYNMDQLKEQLEQAVRLADALADSCYGRMPADSSDSISVEAIHVRRLFAFLSSPAIAPIVAKVKG